MSGNKRNYNVPHHVINVKTGRPLDNTEGNDFHSAIDKYRENYSNDRLCVMYQKGLDVVENNTPTVLELNEHAFKSSICEFVAHESIFKDDDGAYCIYPEDLGGALGGAIKEYLEQLK